MIGTGEPVSVSARTAAFVEAESCSGWSRLDLDLDLLDVGTWSIRLPVTHAAVPTLAVDGSGIVVRRPGASRPLWSGFRTGARLVLAVDDQGHEVAEVEYAGVTDDVVLAGVLGYPLPTADSGPGALSVLTPTQDTRTGRPAAILRDLVAANTSTAAPARRRIPWLTVAASPAAVAAGDVLTGWPVTRGRSLLDLAVDLYDRSGGAFVVRVLQSDTEDGLTVHIDVPDDYLDAEWPASLLDLQRHLSVTDAVVAEVKSSTDVPSWVRVDRAGARPLPFVREVLIESSGALVDVQADAGAQLARDAETVTAEVSIVDTPAAAWGVAYDLGGRVAVGVPAAYAAAVGLASTSVVDLVSGVHVTHPGGGAPLTVAPVLGRPAADGAPDRFSAALARDLLATLRKRA